MKFGLAGGGTGGHVYPALAVAEHLREPGDSLLYYGTEKGPERRLAQQRGIEFRPVPAAQVRVRKPWLLARGLYQLWNGTRAARRLLQEDRPAAVFATGGYAAAPVGRAARQEGIPLIVFLPDARPGWAVRFLARYATTVACAVDAATTSLPAGKTVVTGYPVRPEFALATREEGIARFNLDPALPTILIAGGSLGAHSINVAVARALPLWLQDAQVIHVSGRDEESWLEEERDRLSASARSRYHLFGYTDEMPWAMAASDLAVMRAGASTLGELPIAGLPVVSIPGAFSDQAVNAEYLASHGAAVHLPADRIAELETLVMALVHDPARREEMARAMRALARPDAAAHIASIVRQAAGVQEAAA